MMPKSLKTDIRNFLTKLNNIYIYNIEEFEFEKRTSNNLSNIDFEQKEIILYTNSKLIFTGPRAYLSSNEKNFFLITGTGIMMHLPIVDLLSKNDKLGFEKIETNIEEFTSNYKTGLSTYSQTSFIKNLFIKDNQMFVSLVIKENDACFKHSILSGEINLDKINFEEFLTINECRIFYSNYVGGNLIDYKDNKLLYTIGDWSICEDLRWLANGKEFCRKNNAQNMNSFLGKIYEIDLKTKELKIISIGHDNPQGILYDKDNDIIFSTEHGPMGGDELNMNVNPTTSDIKNYGYPISSYGEHYGYPNEEVMFKYEEAPFYKSHEDYGFVEPIDYFVPSIGISDLTLVKDKLYVTSLGANIDEGDLSLYEYELSSDHKKINSKKRYKIYERIRDIHQIDEYLVLFLETTGTIAIYKPSMTE
ncbi:PQQ-dependent sugar dehydrogenase [Candidatus Pelagibacter communis]|uniref:PQQ-dependent sugar dehydrogenase n=1 Tax=Pelagibacter ubique TaxID=198252 RepID=UPI00094BF9F8|nr:PQQ-dependent sugar dehydrogenase [Candidatus Pelagibacter ubique]|tara:strand:- start:3341 stop:4597 length:1257 start_codon:yes stop_codon:yes gene_type:complete